MARVAAGDREAFESLYRDHAPAVMSLLYHLTFDRALAEDLTQETFVRAWRAASRYRPVAAVRTWLLAIARRRAWNEGAKRRVRAHLSKPMPADESADPSWHDPSRALSIGEEASRARAALSSLSPRLRLVFVLVRLERRSLAEAAEVAGIPVGTVKSRLAAAEDFLRRRLSGDAR
jgi:RNA polymerase sigma-70 factor (ECF subfamily)